MTAGLRAVPHQREIIDRRLVAADAHHGVVELVDVRAQRRRVPDLVEVRPFGLDVAEQRLDPGLIGRRVRPAAVLGEGIVRDLRTRVGGPITRPPK